MKLTFFKALKHFGVYKYAFDETTYMVVDKHCVQFFSSRSNMENNIPMPEVAISRYTRGRYIKERGRHETSCKSNPHNGSPGAN